MSWLVLFGLVGFLVLIISFLQRFLPDKSQATPSQLVEEINQLLPQTQCGHCGYKGCLPYAEAIVEGEAINRCAPGGEQTIAELAKLLNRPYQPLDTYFRPPAVAVIREAECIGCTKCIQACPVDAIIGAPTFMHTVIEQDCTGCDLCVDACPVDCIDMVLQEAQIADEKAKADKARLGFEQRNIRIEQEQQELQEKRRQRQLAREKSQAEIDPVAKALAEAKNKIKASEIEEKAPESQENNDKKALLEQRINKLKEQLAQAKSPAKEVIEKTLAAMQEELAALNSQEKPAENKEVLLLQQRITSLESKLVDAQSPAREVIESTLEKMRQELKQMGVSHD